MGLLGQVWGLAGGGREPRALCGGPAGCGKGWPCHLFPQELTHAPLQFSLQNTHSVLHTPAPTQLLCLWYRALDLCPEWRFSPCTGPLQV